MGQMFGYANWALECEAVRVGHQEGEVTGSDLSANTIEDPENVSRQIERRRSAQPEDAGGDEECPVLWCGEDIVASFGNLARDCRAGITRRDRHCLQALPHRRWRGAKFAPSRIGCSSAPLSHIIVVMGRHTHHLLLLFFLILHTARAHKHHDELTEEEANAPVDSILWIHIFLQATVWGILFPIGMVFGLSRSRWHVPLQVRPARLPSLHFHPPSTLPALPFPFRLPEVIP